MISNDCASVFVRRKLLGLGQLDNDIVAFDPDIQRAFAYTGQRHDAATKGADGLKRCRHAFGIGERDPQNPVR